jgi:hypothetical protein
MIEASEFQHPSAELKYPTVDTGADLCGVGPDVPDESGAGMDQAPLRSSRAGSWGGSAVYGRGLNGLDLTADADMLFCSSYHVCFWHFGRIVNAAWLAIDYLACRICGPDEKRIGTYDRAIIPLGKRAVVIMWCLIRGYNG